MFVIDTLSNFSAKIGSYVLPGAQKSLNMLSTSTVGAFIVEIVSSAYFADTMARNKFPSKTRTLSNATIFIMLSLALRASRNSGIITGEMLKTTLAHTALKILDAAIYTYAFTTTANNNVFDDPDEFVVESSEGITMRKHAGEFTYSFQWNDRDPKVITGVAAYFGLRALDLYLNRGDAMIALMRGQPQAFIRMFPLLNRLV